jgi:23S rRNA (cytosine1962-C5)-methyltransferase
MLTCSCSGLLGEAEFRELVFAAARQPPELGGTARRLRLLAQTGAAPDHPVAADCPETEYLHTLWLSIE